MNCDELRRLIDAYLDDEVDLLTSLTITRHLPECPECASLLQNRRTMRALFQSIPLSAIPTGGLAALQARMHTALQQPIQPSPSASNKLPNRLPILSALRQSLNRSSFGLMAAAFVMLIAVILVTRPLSNQIAPESSLDQVAHQVLTSHIRSLMADHLLDVVSTDLHTVKPWFNGKLDFSPTVIDLAANGFPLIGGRLDYLDQRPVAALIYQRQKHYINVFAWPSGQASNDSLQKFSAQGYNEFYWSQNGTKYWVVSDLNDTDLQAFIALIQSHSTANDK